MQIWTGSENFDICFCVICYCQCRIQTYFGTVWTVWAPKKMRPKNKNLFKRLIYPSSNALNIKYFWTLNYNYWGFFGYH